MFIGCHVSIAGGVFKAPERAATLGAEAMQIFTRSPQGGKAPELTPKICEQFKISNLKFKIKKLLFTHRITSILPLKTIASAMAQSVSCVMSLSVPACSAPNMSWLTLAVRGNFQKKKQTQKLSKHWKNLWKATLDQLNFWLKMLPVPEK